jgi:phosphomannomutase
MIDFLTELKKDFVIGAVGGSDLPKLKEQLQNCKNNFNKAFNLFNYVFTENGLVAFKDGEKFHEKRINEHLGEEKLKELVNFALHYIADLDIPIKRGTFIEYRTGLINMSPIGRNCSHSERLQFHEYNKEARVLEAFRNTMEEKFANKLGLKFAIGGQISFDCYPNVLFFIKN